MANEPKAEEIVARNKAIREGRLTSKRGSAKMRRSKSEGESDYRDENFSIDDLDDDAPKTNQNNNLNCFEFKAKVNDIRQIDRRCEELRL